MNKFLAALVVIAVCLALTHATSRMYRRLQALERGAALEAQSFGVFSQDPKSDKEEEKGLKRCYKECRKIKKQCEHEGCPKKAKDCRKECKDIYTECKEDCKGGGSGVLGYYGDSQYGLSK